MGRIVSWLEHGIEGAEVTIGRQTPSRRRRLTGSFATAEKFSHPKIAVLKLLATESRSHIQSVSEVVAAYDGRAGVVDYMTATGESPYDQPEFEAIVEEGKLILPLLLRDVTIGIGFVVWRLGAVEKVRQAEGISPAIPSDPSLDIRTTAGSVLIWGMQEGFISDLVLRDGKYEDLIPSNLAPLPPRGN